MAGRTINFFLDMGATYSRLSFSGILSLKYYQIVGVEGGLPLLCVAHGEKFYSLTHF